MYKACLREDTSCTPAVQKWRQALQDLRMKNQKTQLTAINNFINHASPYREDKSHFGRADLWQTPAEFLSGSGDCEDYAIAKFFSLIELGFTNEQLRIVVVHDTKRNLDHAVLAVTLADETYILDNLHNTPVRDDQLLRYAPVYSVNLTSRWGHVVTAQIRNQYVAFVADRDNTRKQQQIAAAPPLPERQEKSATFMTSDIADNIRGRFWQLTAIA
ncbi:MAG: transglutaminase-like cysteine peptidase [Pseudomonadota bacterium]